MAMSGGGVEKVRTKTAGSLPTCHLVDHLTADLVEMLRCCESCMGPLGRLKMVVSTSGALRTTSTSCRLWSLLQFDHPLAEFIMQAAGRVEDHGLLASSLTCRLLLSTCRSWDATWLAERVEEASVAMDLASLPALVSMARTVLGAKAAASGLLREEVDRLSRKVVEAWLLTLPEGEGEMGEVVVRVTEGRAGEVAVGRGLLYRYEPTFGQGVARREGVRVALYNVMLDHHQGGEEWEGLELEFTREGEGLDLVDQVRGLGVRLVLCQKVVGEEVQARLEEELGVLVVDRLGTAAFSRVARMVGGRVVSSSSHRLEAKDLGWVDVVEEVEVQGSTYLRLDKQGSGLVSLVVGSLGEEQGEELEIGLGRAVAGLSDLATMARPRVVPGGGCLEAVLAMQGEGHLAGALLRLALVPAGLTMEEASIDTTHGHLWGEEESCVCGLVAMVEGMEVVPCLEVLHGAGREVAPVGRMEGGGRLLLDSMDTKPRALQAALETATNLADIGIVLTC